jgi:imidazoleglycerol-phosphate dehydratase
MAAQRIGRITRKTRETDIHLSIVIDGTGRSEIDTGVPFFDHMLTLFAKHGRFDLDVRCVGDVAVDYHHTVEDVGIALGEAVKQALGDKAGIERYGFFILPMDECLSRVAIDLGGRAFFDYQVACEQPYVRDFSILLVREFFRAFATAVGANLHMKLEAGDEAHHIAECLFKACSRALDAATRIDPRLEGAVPSTKGLL